MSARVVLYYGAHVGSTQGVLRQQRDSQKNRFCIYVAKTVKHYTKHAKAALLTSEDFIKNCDSYNLKPV